MGDYTPSAPIVLQIRKIIYEKFNDVDTKFTNIDILEIIKKNGDIDPSWTIDDVPSFFKQLCDEGMIRNIAQDFTTQWFKIFDEIEKMKCNSCNSEVYLDKSEQRICPNPACKKSI